MNHPSYLELDRAALGAGRPETAQHLAVCAQCAAHVSAVQRPLPVPQWAAQADRKPRRFWPWVTGLAALSAAAAVLLVPRAPVVTAKGQPFVAVYVKRADAVSLWDGRAAIRAGDRLRLRVFPAEYREITVAAEDKVLYAGPIEPGKEVLLPDAFRVDAAPGNEVLRVTLRQGRAEPWTTTIVIPKEQAR